MNTRMSYIVAHESWWWSVPRKTDRAIVAEIHVRKDALTDQGEYDGCHWEFVLEWHDLAGKDALRVGIFDDAFDAFAEIPEFFEALTAFPRPITPVAITAILDTLGFSDQTERRPDAGNTHNNSLRDAILAAAPELSELALSELRRVAVAQPDPIVTVHLSDLAHLVGVDSLRYPQEN